MHELRAAVLMNSCHVMDTIRQQQKKHTKMYEREINEATAAAAHCTPVRIVHWVRRYFMLVLKRCERDADGVQANGK